MALPEKPIEINLDAVSLDAWIAFTEVSAQLQNLRAGGGMAAMAQGLRGAKEVLIQFLCPAWSEEEIGGLNLGEVKQVLGQIGAAMRGPNSTSGTPSTPHTNTGAPSQFEPVSRGRQRPGIARRGRLRPPSA